MWFGILTLWIPDYWPVTVFQVGVVALAATVVLRFHQRFVDLAYGVIPLAFAVGLGVFQCLTGSTAYLFVTETATVKWVTFLAVFLIGMAIFENDEIRGQFRSALVWFGGAVAVIATLQTFTSGGKVFWLFPSGYTETVMGPIVYRNHYAAFIEAILPMALYQAMRRQRNSLMYIAMAAVMYASVIASTSRAGTLLVTGEIAAVALLMWMRRRAVARSSVMVVIAAAVLTAVTGWGAVLGRFGATDPVGVRRELAVASFRMIAAHPWIGVGLGAWSTVYPRYATVDIGAFANQAHTDWLEWTAEGGIIFGLVMASFFAWCVRPAFRTIWGLGVVAVFLHALVDYPFSRPALGSWFVLIAAMAACECRSENRLGCRAAAASACEAAEFRQKYPLRQQSST